MSYKKLCSIAAILYCILPTAGFADTNAVSNTVTAPCDSIYNVDTQQLSLGCVSISEQPEKVYTAQMHLSNVEPIKLTLTHLQINQNPVIEKCSSDYSIASGRLSVGCLKIIDSKRIVITEGKYNFQAENVLNVEQFVLLNDVTATQKEPKSAFSIRVNAPVSGGGWNYNQHKTGFHKPNGGIGGADDTYAWDINLNTGGSTDAGKPVYAVEAGCIYTSDGWGGSSFGQVLINHTAGNINWSTGYLHMKNITAKKNNGQCVEKGEKIGEVSDVGIPGSYHLHFAVYNSHGKYDLQSVDANINNPTTYPLQPEPSQLATYFDGTGSLIDPTHTNTGCSSDIVKLHPHPDKYSAGMFQIYRIPGMCESVEISGGLRFADVEVRSWDGYGKDSEYYRLNMDGSPATVPLKANTSWSLLAFKTTAPVINSVSVNAKCVTQKTASANVLKQASGQPMKFENVNSWGGNGSLINHCSNPFQTGGYGRNRDDVVLMRDNPTLSVFQVTHSTSCKRVRFTTPQPFYLSWKLWDEKDWQGSNTSGGKTINDGDAFAFPTSDTWWLLKVNTGATRQDFTIVKAVCEP